LVLFACTSGLDPREILAPFRFAENIFDLVSFQFNDLRKCIGCVLFEISFLGSLILFSLFSEGSPGSDLLCTEPDYLCLLWGPGSWNWSFEKSPEARGAMLDSPMCLTIWEAGRENLSTIFCLLDSGLLARNGNRAHEQGEACLFSSLS
jgi:hypothetical protein